MSHVRVAILCILAVSTSACRMEPREDVVPPEQLGLDWTRTELHFGRAAPSQTGDTVDDIAWDRFLAEIVTPRFPDGLSVIDATGQWRDPTTGRIIHEHSKCLVLVHPPDPATHQKIEEIAAEYERRFGQDAVLRVTSPARVRF